MAKDFQIHAIALCKNEADVIGNCLEAASGWADYIYVYDNQSTDETWQIVQQFAKDNPRLVPWKKHGKVYSDSLRAEVFDRFRANTRHGDWWCRLDVDEFYIDEPREFLSRVPMSHHVVWGVTVEYKVTDRDLDRIDFERPFEAVRPQMRYYQVHWSEIRFFRYRRRMRWAMDADWPRHLGPVWPERIRFRHYPLRSPRQIQERLDMRRETRRLGFQGWDHASQEDWREKVVSADACQVDHDDERYVIDESALPDHLGPWWRRAVQRVMHGLRIWP